MPSSAKEETTEVQFLDPKDYAQNRRLKQIYDARKAVRSVYATGHEKVNDRKETRYDESDFRNEYAQVVVTYAIEIEPILVRSDSDILNKELEEFDKTIEELIDSNGKVETRNYDYPKIESMRWVRRQIDQELGRLGIGLDIDEDELPVHDLG